MNIDSLERDYTRLLLLAVVVHIYHDWGFWAQIGVPCFALGMAWFYQWIQLRERDRVQQNER